MANDLRNYEPALRAGSDITTTGAITGGTITSTGALTASYGITVASGQSIAGAGTGSNGIVLSNLKNSAATALSGTQKDIEISIGGVAYYFTVYPTKA